MTDNRRASITAVLFFILTLHGSLLAGSIRFLPWDDEVAARKIGLQDGAKVNILQNLHPHKRSKSIQVGSGEAPLLLVALDRTSPDGKPVTVEIKASAGFQSPLVLILPDAKHPTGFRTFVIEDNASNFQWGTVRFINATGKALLVRLEKTIKTLPVTWTPVDLAPGGATRNVGVQVVTSEDRDSILYSAIWEHDPEVRELAIIIPGADVRTGAIDFKIIPEDRRTIAPEAAAKAP